MKKIILGVVILGTLFSFSCSRNIQEKSTNNTTKNQEIKQDKVGNIPIGGESTESGSIFSGSIQ